MCVCLFQLGVGGPGRSVGMGQGWTVALLPAADSTGSTLCLHLTAAPNGGTLPADHHLFGGWQHSRATSPRLDHSTPHPPPLCHPTLPALATHLTLTPDLWLTCPAWEDLLPSHPDSPGMMVSFVTLYRCCFIHSF